MNGNAAFIWFQDYVFDRTHVWYIDGILYFQAAQADVVSGMPCCIIGMKGKPDNKSSDLFEPWLPAVHVMSLLSLSDKKNTCGNHWYLTCSRLPCAITYCWLIATNGMCCCRSVALLSHRTLTAKGNVWWMVRRFVPPCCLEIYDSSESVMKTACLGSAVWCDNWRWQKLFWEMLSYLFLALVYLNTWSNGCQLLPTGLNI